MKFRLEIVAAVLRAYEKDETETGPFLFSCTLTADQGAAMLKGLATDKILLMLDPRNRLALRRLLRAGGFRTISWRRHTAGHADRLQVHPL